MNPAGASRTKHSPAAKLQHSPGPVAVPQVPSLRQTPDTTVPLRVGHRARSIVQPGKGTFPLCGGNEQHPELEVPGVSVTIDSTQESTAASIVAPSPLTAHPPGASVLAIAWLNLVSAVVETRGIDRGLRLNRSLLALDFASIFFAAALLLAIEHFCAGVWPARNPVDIAARSTAASSQATPVRASVVRVILFRPFWSARVTILATAMPGRR